VAPNDGTSWGPHQSAKGLPLFRRRACRVHRQEAVRLGCRRKGWGGRTIDHFRAFSARFDGEMLQKIQSFQQDTDGTATGRRSMGPRNGVTFSVIPLAISWTPPFEMTKSRAVKPEGVVERYNWLTKSHNSRFWKDSSECSPRRLQISMGILVLIKTSYVEYWYRVRLGHAEYECWRSWDLVRCRQLKATLLQVTAIGNF
jgi:hypothetical protein